MGRGYQGKERKRGKGRFNHLLQSRNSSPKTDKTGKAQQYLEWANDAGYSSPDLYLLLSGMYKNIDNLTLEIRALENYHKKYPEGKDIDSLDIRLFETYVESEQWNKAKGLWPDS
ncbi:MAG: hypothetical protein U5L09_22695 [Bacteroidales bacterium]|nr:hypothetical protein [Bacteroidales bacterium]